MVSLSLFTRLVFSPAFPFLIIPSTNVFFVSPPIPPSIPQICNYSSKHRLEAVMLIPPTRPCYKIQSRETDTCPSGMGPTYNPSAKKTNALEKKPFLGNKINCKNLPDKIIINRRTRKGNKPQVLNNRQSTMPWWSRRIFLFVVSTTLTISIAEGETPPPQPPQNAVTSAAGQNNCVDSEPKCSLWASQGECQTNAIWMMANCRRSCQSCQGGDRAWQLRTQLAKNYDNTTSSNSTRTVRIESVRISHMEIDETRELARLFGRLVLSWNDSKVSWDREHWGVSWLNFYWVQIWTPQLMQINSPSATPGQINGKVLAANYTGQVYMWTDFQFVVPYHFEYEDFPKDRQRVCYQFDDKRYFAVRFVVADDVHNKRHESISEAHVSGWNIVEMDIQDSKYVVQLLGDWRQNPFDIQSTNCELCVRLQRNAVYWLPELLAPALVTSALTLCSVLFQLALPQALLLAFSLLCQLLSMQLMNTRMPSYTGTAPSILQFAAFNLLSTGVLFIFTLFLRRFSQTNSQIPLPRSVYAFASLLDKLMPLPKGARELADENVPQGNYADIALTMNNLLFCACTFIYGWTIIFMLII